jgi:hypothetical protein
MVLNIEFYKITLNEKLPTNNFNYENSAKEFLEKKETVVLKRVLDKQKGAPDYFYKDNYGITNYIEIKCNCDGFRMEQARFLSKLLKEDSLINYRLIYFDIVFNDPQEEKYEINTIFCNNKNLKYYKNKINEIFDKTTALQEVLLDDLKFLFKEIDKSVIINILKELKKKGNIYEPKKGHYVRL